MYQLTFPHPDDSSSPVVVYEAWSSIQNEKALTKILQTFQHKVVEKFPNFRPVQVVVDFSWPIIKGSVKAFNNQDIFQYIEFAHSLLTCKDGNTLALTIVVICKWHHGEAVKRNFPKQMCKKIKHFYQVLASLLQSSLTLKDFYFTMRLFFIVAHNKFYTPSVDHAMSQIQECLKNLRNRNVHFQDVYNTQRESQVPEEDNQVPADDSQVPEMESNIPEVDGSGDRPLRDSPFLKDVNLILKGVLQEVSETGKVANKYYCPSFSEYYVKQWIPFPAHLQAFQEVLQWNHDPDERVKSSRMKHTTNNYLKTN